MMDQERNVNDNLDKQIVTIDSDVFKNTLNSVDAIIFDMDGVIILSEDVKFEAYKVVFEEEFSVLLDSTDVSWRGKSEGEVIGYWLKKMSIHYEGEFSNLITKKRTVYRKFLHNGTVKLVRGIQEFLFHIHRDLNKKLGLATVSMAVDQKTIFSMFALDAYFSAVATVETIKYPKPHPEIYCKTAELLNVSPERCLVFEDTPTGFMAARAAGMKVIPVLTSYSRSDFIGADICIRNFDSQRQ